MNIKYIPILSILSIYLFIYCFCFVDKKENEYIKDITKGKINTTYLNEINKKSINKGLYYAVMWQKIDIALILLKEYNADPNEKSEFNTYPLYSSLLHNNIQITKLLIDYNSDCNSKNSWTEETPMMIASKTGNVDNFKLLYKKGANIHSIDKLNKTAMHYALQEGHFYIARYLTYYGAKIDKNEEEKLMKSIFKLKDYYLFCYIQQIHRILKANKNPFAFVELGQEGWPEPNPFHDQTSSGLFLEYRSGYPDSLWSPWGSIKLIGSGLMKDILETTNPLLSYLNITEYIPKTFSKWGTYGPIFKINAFKKNPIESIKEDDTNYYAGYKITLKIWNKMFKK